MWNYEKKLLFPIKNPKPNPAAAKLILRLLDFEYGSAMCYLCQRHAMPYEEGKALLTEIGTEELAHFELLAALARRLTRHLSARELSEAGLSEYYLEHTLGMPVGARACFLSKGDPITDLHECLAKEQAARTNFDNLLRLMDDPDVIGPLKFLREREIEHYKQFNDMLTRVRGCIDAKCCYEYNPAFDLCSLKIDEDFDW